MCLWFRSFISSRTLYRCRTLISFTFRFHLAAPSSDYCGDSLKWVWCYYFRPIVKSGNPNSRLRNSLSEVKAVNFWFKTMKSALVYDTVTWFIHSGMIILNAVRPFVHIMWKKAILNDVFSQFWVLIINYWSEMVEDGVWQLFGHNWILFFFYPLFES